MLKKIILIFFNCFLFNLINAQKFDKTIPLSNGEKIWSGVIRDGDKMPYLAGYKYDLYGNNQGNQLQPLLISNKGLWLWSEEPFSFEIQNDKIFISNALGEVKFGRHGNTLADARNFISTNYFPPSGKIVDINLISKPQYNTWIELTYNQNQKDILKYAKSILDNGFEPGVIMIDDTWQEDYGLWKFNLGRFPNPKQMVEQLHKWGFKVMLWVCPFVSADQTILVKKLMKEKAFLLQQTPENNSWKNATEPAIIKWWNGYSALLDFTNPFAVDWFNNQLDNLVNTYGIDGFKFDAGDMYFYPSYALSKLPVSPNRHCELYAKLGLRFPLNELRACWKLGGQALAQRLHDKAHSWDDLRKLIPHMITEGLSGYTFSCPDLIGGGDFESFLDSKKFNQNILVRSAQIHSLMPMMQFSVAPWRVLDERHLDAVKKSIRIRKLFTPNILNLAKNSAKTGEPIISSLEYIFPNQGYLEIKDQFMLGKDILVAPIIDESFSRKVVLPSGKWKSDEGIYYDGNATYTIQVPLERLPYFTLVSK